MGYGGDEKNFDVSVDKEVVFVGEDIVGVAEASGDGADEANIDVTSNPNVGSKSGTGSVSFTFPTTAEHVGTVTISGEAGD